LSSWYHFDVSLFQELAENLCNDRSPEDALQRLVAVARHVVSCDAVALLRLEAGVLVPIVVDGLRPEVIGRRFVPSEHPRLGRILASRVPVRFTDLSLPDPFDGLFVAYPNVLARAHACTGCPLLVGNVVVGVLTFEALGPTAFDHVPDETVSTLASFATASLRTASLVEALAEAAARTHGSGQLEHKQRAQGAGELLGKSPAVIRVRKEIALLARSDLPALITGETGVGKELVVHAVHAQSRRRDRTLVHVNCAALPQALAESELFGHVRGAFTGAVDNRAGKFEVADKGTLLLDEIGELPLLVQSKLLRVLQSGEVQRVGSDRTLRVDVRVIAATNRDLTEEVRAGRFRDDLFYRLSVFPLHVPPLREHPEDVPLLSGHFLDLAKARLDLGQLRLTPEARARLRGHDWPGNVRELEHTLLRAALRASEGGRRSTIVIDEHHLGLQATRSGGAAGASTPPASSPVALRDAVDAFTGGLIRATMSECGDNWAEAARRLGLHRGNLQRLAHRLGVHPRAATTKATDSRRT
jgi:anaerobic nitric oxide reductase transcription regulator